MIKVLLRPLMICIPFALGICFPAAHVLAGPPWNAIRYTLMVMVFNSCLQIRLTELRVRREHLLLAAANLLMGVVPWGLCRLCFPDRLDLALTCFFVGIAPTAAAAPVVVSFLRGRTGFALTGFAFDTCCIALSLPVLLPLAAGEFTADFVWRVGDMLFWVLLVPFLAAMLIRRLWPGAPAFAKRIRLFVFSLWSCMLFVLAALARRYFIDHPETPAATALLIAGISLGFCAVNFGLGRLLGPKRTRRECSQLLGQKNTSLAIYLALQFAGPLPALGPVFYILWHNLWNAYQMYACDRRRMRRARRNAATT